MKSNMLGYIALTITLCTCFCIGGYRKGIDWASKQYKEVCEKYEENFYDAMKMADKYRKIAERLLKEKYEYQKPEDKKQNSEVKA